MPEIIDLDQICDNFEKENEQRQMEKFKCIIDEYSILCNVNFREVNPSARDDYDVFDSLFQLTVAQPQYYEEFHGILSKYGFNDKAYLEYLIKKITRNSSNVDAYIDGLISVGLLKDVYDSDKDKSIYVESILGKYNFFFANEYFEDNKKIVDYIENSDTSGNCHVNTLFLLNTLKKGEAITAKCSNMFNSFYHSFYKLDEMICDLNINCVMNENNYNTIYNPKIMSVVKYEDLESKQVNIKKNCKSTLEELLEIAIYEELNNKT